MSYRVTKSNRLALNARVRVTAGGLVQEQEVRSGGSYISQSDLRLHFGLGKIGEVDKVEIFWPSGTKDVVTQLPADKFYGVLKGKGVAPLDAVRPDAAVVPALSAKHP